MPESAQYRQAEEAEQVEKDLQRIPCRKEARNIGEARRGETCSELD
jgi:hypothetical protein